MKYLITGACGFIGFSLSKKLLESNHKVVGIDNINNYYDVSLKKARLFQLRKKSNFTFIKLNLEDYEEIHELFSKNEFDCVVNLAAQAGVRYSLINPHAYINSNIIGFTNVLENCRNFKIKHLIYASSSSVYGANTKMPFAVSDQTDKPMSFYAVTKKTNELMAYSYSSLYDLPCTGLRFFTVYGPWGRPDMALYLFTKAILDGRPIDVFNHGCMVRNLTYIDDVVDAIIKVSNGIPESKHRLYNVANSNPVKLTKLIELLESGLKRKAKKNFLPIQPGDVPITCADIDDLVKDTGFKPLVSIEKGIKLFIEWYSEYYATRI